MSSQSLNIILTFVPIYDLSVINLYVPATHETISHLACTDRTHLYDRIVSHRIYCTFYTHTWFSFWILNEHVG